MLDAIQDRAAGAVMGGLVGDALGLGPHWYYDLKEMRRDYGDWIEGYTDPRPDRYHAGLKAGQPSQAGIILTMLLRSVVEKEGYDEEDFCRRLDGLENGSTLVSLAKRLGEQAGYDPSSGQTP